MMKIFRKIRQQLLIKKNWGGYLIYAAMEIILVVIGILIALQVNNWNLRQIQNNKEVAYQEEIRNSLLQDLTKIESIKAFNKEKDSCIIAGIELLGTEMNNKNRVLKFYDLIPTLAAYMSYHPNYVAFNNMISAESISLIKDDSLRNSVAHYYGKEEYELEKIQERMKEKTHEFLDTVIPLLLNKELAASREGSNLNFEYPSISENEFHKNPIVYYELTMMKVSIETQNMFLEESKSEIENILLLISNTE